MIIFLSIIGWYSGYARISIDTVPKLLVGLCTFIILINAFLSAWFYMVKQALNLTSHVFIFDKDRAKALINLILHFPKGIGRLFFPLCGISLVLVAIYTVAATIINFFVSKYVSPLDLTTLGIGYSFMSSEEIFNEIMELSNVQLVALNCWYILLGLVTLFVSFFGLLWIPEVVYGEKDPYRALKISIQKIFMFSWEYTLLFSFLVILYIVTCVTNAILMINPVLYFMVLIISYYFILYTVVLLFSYYETMFLKED
ncbi:hypothetical protein IJ579_06345 [bacterium]|nr:hypothetical protein [bacterium]